MHRKIIFILFLLATFQTNAQTDSLKKIRISFMGDIMQHGPQIRSAYNPVNDNYNYFPCFEWIAPSIRESDLAIANLELTLAGKPFSGYPTFSAPDELALALKKSGIDVLVTANNHSLDRRKKGLERTIQMLDSFNIPHTGTFKDKRERDENYPLIINKNGIKIALLNYTYGTNGIPVSEPNIVNLIDTTQIRLDIEKAKEKLADVIIVFTHWGLEYQNLPNRDQKLVAQFCKEHGVNMVIGSHPHVLQPIEWKGDFLVVYSLGNFVSNQRDRYKDGGMIFTVELSVDPELHHCTVTEAGYQLVWVYKRPVGSISEYYILPAAQMNSKNFISEKDDQEKMDLFLSDSRVLFTKNNHGNIKEYKYQINYLPHYNIKGELVETIHSEVRQNLSYNKTEPSKSIYSITQKPKNPTPDSQLPQSNHTVYRIQFLATSQELDLNQLDKKYFGSVSSENAKGFTRYFTGNFTSKEDAEDFLMVIINETKYKDAFVVEKEME